MQSRKNAHTLSGNLAAYGRRHRSRRTRSVLRAGMDVFDILDRLVAFPSVAGRPNADIAGWTAAYLAEHGTQVTVLPGPEGDRSNLFATIGPADIPGYILSGHMDVVPAGELH